MVIANMERGIFQRYLISTSTKQRHLAKLLSLLDWIRRFGFTSTAVLEELWGLDRSTINRLLRRYIKADVIAELPTFCCRDKRLFMLKPEGLRILSEFHNEELKYACKPSTINFKVVTHDLMVQAIVAKGCYEGRYKFFITEAEQGKEGVERKRRFDAIVFEMETAELIALECESSAKSIPHRLKILKSTEHSIKELNKVSRVLYFSHKARYLKDLERIHQKLFNNPDNDLDEIWFKQHLKAVYAREYRDMLYAKFWLIT